MQSLDQTSAIADEDHAISMIENDAKNMLTVFIDKAPEVGIGLAFFVVLFLLARPLSNLLIKPVRLFSHSELLRIVVRRTVSFLIIMLGVYIFLRMAGLTQFAVAIVSGTGLMGLIVGFAFKDIAENFIASLLLSIQKPFRLGEVIEIEGHIGVVNQVTSRATTLVDFDGNHIQIPNATIYKNVMKNFTANPKMRTDFVIGVGYDFSINEAQELANKIIKKHDAVLEVPPPQVLIDELGSSTVNLKIYVWLDSEKTSILKLRSVLQKAVLKGFEDANIPMPDDARERIIIQPGGNEKASNCEEPSPNVRSSAPDFLTNEEVSSEIEEIRDQAKRSRAPESGSNIL